jgi:hypothetical protein
MNVQMDVIKDEITSTGEIDRQFETEIAVATGGIFTFPIHDLYSDLMQGLLKQTLYITVPTVVKNLKEAQHPALCISMYMFLCYKARQQKTNKVWANRTHLKHNLKLSSNMVDTIRMELEELGIIEVIKQESVKKGQMSKVFIKINYLLSQDFIEKHFR